MWIDIVDIEARTVDDEVGRVHGGPAYQQSERLVPTFEADMLALRQTIAAVAGLMLLACGGPAQPRDRPSQAEPTPAGFVRLGPPPEAGWRERVDEPGQTLAEYRESAPNRPTAARGVLYLVPLEPYPDRVVLPDDLPSMKLEEDGAVTFVFSPAPADLAVFLGAFFAIPARVLDGRPLAELGVEPVRDHRHHAQFDARALLRVLAPSLPNDAYSMTALIARDLVVGEQEFAYGFGLYSERLAIASFAQLDPRFLGHSYDEDAFQAKIRARTHKVLAHEVGHTLGLQHCDAFACVMNGVAHLDELDATPLHLCPVCLAKLRWLYAFDEQARYRALADYYAGHELPGPARWASARAADR